jgi:dihydrofolate synthase/folylpolyglutamate synthase
MISGLEKILHFTEAHARQTIVVAGTNGKGSVCATLEALLLSAGKRVGMYTSPHLKETTERFRVNGQDISEEVFIQAYQAVFSKTDGQTDGMSLSHFEMLTLMAAWIFYSEKIIPPLDWVILEVGLGGTWDATNAIPHKNCIITPLGLDHQQLLGNTIEEIAANKFGITSNGALVVHSPLPEEVRSLALQTQEKTQSRWMESIPAVWSVQYTGNEPKFIIHTPWGNAPLTLAGERAVQNTATALTLFDELGYSPAQHLTALNHVRWPGRMGLYNYNLSHCKCPIYLSGDHNPSGVRSLCELLPYYRRKRLLILVGVAEDKDFHGILSQLITIPGSALYLTETPFRTRNLKDYGVWLDRAEGSWTSPKDALKNLASHAQADDMILVTGSLYLIGSLMAELQ